MDGTDKSLFEECDGELQHIPWPEQSPELNIAEQHWSALETRMKNRFPSPTSLKQLEHVLQEEWHKITLETIQNLHESIPRNVAEKVVQHHINKEMWSVTVVFPSFCPTPVCHFQNEQSLSESPTPNAIQLFDWILIHSIHDASEGIPGFQEAIFKPLN
jgi:hypothetical protein